MIEERNWKETTSLADCQQVYSVSLKSELDELPHIVWLGHASFLLQWRGKTILIDPVFKKWIGPFRRNVPIPDLGELPRIDSILVTHAHMDHLDTRWIGQAEADVVIVPGKTKRFFTKADRERIVSLEIGEETDVGNLRVKTIFAKHGGWRYPWQRGYFACGYLVSDGTQNVYFCGDSAWSSHFAELGESVRIDIAVLPIGAYSPRWFLGTRHMNPNEALDAADALRARKVIPFHFGSYRLSLEPLNEPLRWFARESAERGVEWFLPYCL